MTPHDSTRCAEKPADILIEALRKNPDVKLEFTPSEPVGAVDADAEALTWLRNKRENTSGGERSKRIISHIITRLARATPAEGSECGCDLSTPRFERSCGVHGLRSKQGDVWPIASLPATSAPLYTTPPRSPATVTEEMVQTAARVLHPVEDQSLTRQLARRDLIRKALTAALGGRDAEA